MENDFLKRRSEIFLELFEPIYSDYEKSLSDKKIIDFNDMINLATKYVRDGKYTSPIKYILVDEFQDISFGRYNLLKSLLDYNAGSKIFCVGDDWQSIFRFTGSDISLFTDFEKYFGVTKRSTITTTYRFNKDLIRISSNFIQKNPNQVKKVLSSTENTRPRVTNNEGIRKRSFQYFYYKYASLMSEEVRQAYFDWAENLFQLSETDIAGIPSTFLKPIIHEHKFAADTPFVLLVGFVSDSYANTERLVRQLILSGLKYERIIIIDNTADVSLANIMRVEPSIVLVERRDWLQKLREGYYGNYFKGFEEINSISLGRTILHHHLHAASGQYESPVFWILDDDMTLSCTSADNIIFDLQKLINDNIGTNDIVIGGITNDAPIPTLHCLRTQLIDFQYSIKRPSIDCDFMNIRGKPDYYYDLTDMHTDHLEAPIYCSSPDELKLQLIFSGKAVTRPALIREIPTTNAVVSRKGANTIVFNREVLTAFPVVSLTVNNVFSRRGDFFWAFVNQIILNRKVIEHSFALDHARPLKPFVLSEEMGKAAYDIIGFAFNKAIRLTVEREDAAMKNTAIEFTDIDRQIFFDSFLLHLRKRRAKFIMNYNRILGLTKLIAEEMGSATIYLTQIEDERCLEVFDSILNEASRKENSMTFLSSLERLTSNISVFD